EEDGGQVAPIAAQTRGQRPEAHERRIGRRDIFARWLPVARVAFIFRGRGRFFSAHSTPIKRRSRLQRDKACRAKSATYLPTKPFNSRARNPIRVNPTT